MIEKSDRIFTATDDENCPKSNKILHFNCEISCIRHQQQQQQNWIIRMRKQNRLQSTISHTARVVRRRYDVHAENPVRTFRFSRFYEMEWKFVRSFIRPFCLSCTLHHPPRHFYSLNEFRLYTFFSVYSSASSSIAYFGVCSVWHMHRLVFVHNFLLFPVHAFYIYLIFFVLALICTCVWISFYLKFAKHLSSGESVVW